MADFSGDGLYEMFMCGTTISEKHTEKEFVNMNNKDKVQKVGFKIGGKIVDIDISHEKIDALIYSLKQLRKSSDVIEGQGHDKFDKISRQHFFHCQKCREIVDNEHIFNYFKYVSGVNENGFYVNFGDEYGKRYFKEPKK